MNVGHNPTMSWVVVYQYGTAVALCGALLVLVAQRVRREHWRGLRFLVIAPLSVVAWYLLEFCALAYGCVRLNGAGC